MLRRHTNFAALLIAMAGFALGGCRAPSAPHRDRPKIPAEARMIDIVVHSRLLGKDVPVRLVAPANVAQGAPVVYLLHGAGEDYRNWTNESSIADLAANGILLVMPDGLGTYYVNDARGHRYEDFFFAELMPAVRAQFPQAAQDRAGTAIVGNSRGGFAAVLYGLKHPDVFGYVGGLSSALDLAKRPFRWRAPGNSLAYRRVFGPRGSRVRRENDPYRLALAIAPERAPYFDLSCARHDVLLPSNQAFVAVLAQRNLAHRFELVEGDHDWGVWNAQLPGLESRLLAHFGGSAMTPAQDVRASPAPNAIR
jgi:putative tributyrin esterase